MKKSKIEIKWALISAAMYLLWMLLEKLTGLHDKYLEQQQYITALILFPSFIIYVLALSDKKRTTYSGSITYKQSFLSGCLLSVYIVVLSPVNQLITHYLISPDYFENITSYTVQKGILTKVQAIQQFNIGNYIITGLVAGLITGVIFSAIISFFIKSKNINHEQEK
ncbi:DUF4199 domain-containing protein [Chitinophaga deserti]|uniref:DUF4199 domain-containing protein n=1 Tax=Chitinophaga deserti TaxID=2164099 RepID=UPI000D6ADC82|nr:DUF4199 domain-containing protein [Chitinophaga deserti]